MRRNLIAGLAVATAAATALGATVVFGSESATEVRPEVARVDVTMGGAAPAAPARPAAKKAKKPKVVYLEGSGTVDTANTGPYIDFGLNATKNLCPRVINGGVASPDTNLYQQGSYVDGRTYHVLMGLDDEVTEPTDPPLTIQYQSHLVCLRGVK